MAALLPPAELQFCDGNGNPYALGTLGTYVINTLTPKATWTDMGATSLNANPIVLDAAGRCLVFGDGLYRTILKDALGNEIWDKPSTTLVSAAMAPVVAAATIADAVILLGIQDLIDVEAAARAAADSTETAARIAADAAEAAARIAADATLTAALAAETAARIAGDAATGAQWGSASTTAGHVRVTFGTAFSGTPAVLVTLIGGGFTSGYTYTFNVSSDTTGFDCWAMEMFMDGGFLKIQPGAVGAIPFYWSAAEAT